MWERNEVAGFAGTALNKEPASYLILHPKVQPAGTSITFPEGSRFIVNGLKEHLLAFPSSPFVCYKFVQVGAVTLSVPNLIPLVTAGIMGWVGVPLKPSTVLVFQCGTGIAIDITIRFPVNYKQELLLYGNNIRNCYTIRHTGLSIVESTALGKGLQDL